MLSVRAMILACVVLECWQDDLGVILCPCVKLRVISEDTTMIAIEGHLHGFGSIVSIVFIADNLSRHREQSTLSDRSREYSVFCFQLNF